VLASTLLRRVVQGLTSGVPSKKLLPSQPTIHAVSILPLRVMLAGNLRYIRGGNLQYTSHIIGETAKNAMKPHSFDFDW